jgi:hypothetical protein
MAGDDSVRSGFVPDEIYGGKTTMQRRIAMVVCVTAGVLLGLAVTAFAADASSSKSAVGTWILNPTKSRFQNMPSPKMERLRVSKDDQTGLVWILTGAGSDGKGYHDEYDGPADGSFHPIKSDLTPRTVAYTRADAGTSWIVKDQAGTIVETGSMSVSPDGRTMTWKGTRKTADGESQFTSVYDRR